MGIWVKSQNKLKLLNIKALQIAGGIVEGVSADGEGWTLGEYETELRALEVLNQIQQKLMDGYRSDIIIGPTRVYRENVFEMPEE